MATYTLDVLHPAATDSGPGTESVPFKTMKATAPKLAPGDALSIKKGIYRESAVDIAANGTSSDPIRILGEPDVIFRGTKPLTGFTKTTGYTSVYSVAVPTFTPARVVETNVARWKPIHVADPNGVTFDLVRPVGYYPVTSIALVQAAKGTFYWDAAAKILYFQTFDGGDPRTVPYGLESGADYDGTLKIKGKFLSVDAIRMEYARLFQFEGASDSSLTHIELDGVPLYAHSSTRCVIDGVFSENVIQRGPTDWHTSGAGTALSVFASSSQITVENAAITRGWNSVSVSGVDCVLRNAAIWGFPNHGLGASGTNNLFDRVSVWNAQDAVYATASVNNTLRNCLFYEAIHVRSLSSGTTLRNNVIFGGVFVTADSVAGFNSDYNMLIMDGVLDDYQLGAVPKVSTLAQIQALGQELHSREAPSPFGLFTGWYGRMAQRAMLTPSVTSPLIDAGDPTTPVPPGGGCVVDIGPVERVA